MWEKDGGLRSRWKGPDGTKYRPDPWDGGGGGLGGW